MRAFTAVNGLLIAADPMEFARELEAVAERTGSLADATDRLEIWLGERVRRL